ncbi:sugar ABC transporter ATP-binding protein [Inquilinus sp. NPDC058860]|uniref:sugar ABC transporter ATP-binding protein n=1 Tax=Inquilinus sp. NPDC058860 TaxID=3346652 RepID=UPI0036A1917D
MTVPSPALGPVLSVQGLGKTFGTVAVLQEIGFDLLPGEVHAVIGENGAGKSTLMKILAGHLEPTAGTIALNGAPIRFAGPVDAERHGIVLVHQEILLAPHLTVAENLFLGRELRRGLAVDDRAMNARAAEAVRSLGAEIDPAVVVAQLSIAQRQLVQIAQALLVPHSVVIFDEPTASLTSHETDALLKVIHDIRAKGVGVLYVSHRLPEVKAIADRVTVLRDGRLVGTRPAAELQPLDMARMMVGRDMANLYPPRTDAPSGDPVLEVKGMTVPRYAEDATFTLRRGEILGFAGLVGAGRTELLEGVLGLRTAHGEVFRDGKSARFATVRDSMAAGIVYLSEDRKGKGLLLAQDLRINLTLAALKRFTRGPVIDAAKEWAELDRAIAAFDVRTRRKDLLAGQLSGGNQQKLLLGKMMLLEPEIVVIDEPTRGIDIGTKQQIYRFVAELAAQGKSVIVISSEMQELIGLCHRILVMRSGRIVGEVTGDAMTEDEIVTYATGVKTMAPAEASVEQA